MGNRLTKIYTRTGDEGKTGLADGGRRLDKDAPRMVAIGSVDELNCMLGVVIAHADIDFIQSTLLEVQHHLFDLGGELSLPGESIILAQQVEFLEHALDQLNADLPALKEFILPSGNTGGSFCHLARATCRRAERTVVSLGRQESVNPQSLAYLNRLSDLLFVMARTLVRQAGVGEVFWRSPKLKD